MNNKEFWESKWNNNETKWDIGFPSPAIINYLEKYPNKQDKILIPGCGSAYEAQWLVDHGFTNITLVDISEIATELLSRKFQQNPNINIVCKDFFDLEDNYNLIIEQTFFCAINPNLRTDYVNKMANLLDKNGQLIGLLFDKEFEQEGPPFGGNKEDYIALFKEKFDLIKIESTLESIAQRLGSEIWFECQLKESL